MTRKAGLTVALRDVAGHVVSDARAGLDGQLVDPAAQVIIPSDPLFAVQIYPFIVRLPEAWKRLDTWGIGSFGSSDVIVAVSDDGMDIPAPPAPPAQPEFDVTLAGGTFFQRGLDNRKLIFAFDFGNSPMHGPPIVPLNTQPPNPRPVTHQSCVAGIISAAADGMGGHPGGVVGVAPNTRLAAYLRSFPAEGLRSANAYAFYAGLDPGWRRVAPYTINEPFPFLFDTGANMVPGADILNISHAITGGMSPELSFSLQRMTLFGRNRRGMLIFASANNEDRELRHRGAWAEDTNVIRVGATTLDHRDQEQRANYTNFSLIQDQVLDFCAPSDSQNVQFRTSDLVPRIWPFFTTMINPTHQPNSIGELPTQIDGSPMGVTSITRDAQGNDTITASGTPPGTATFFIIRDKTNPLHAELHAVGVLNGNQMSLPQALGFSYAPANGELIFLKNPLGATFDFGGTSAACPIAAGIAALVISARPELTWLEVRDVMRSTAVPINIRYRGFGPANRYRWIDPAFLDLILPDGTLDITRGNRTITAGPVRRGDRFLTLDDTSGIEPRRALLIGAETTLNAPLPKPLFPREIDVDRPDDFEIGDTIFIGRDVQTVLINGVVAGDTVAWVQSVDGLQPNAPIRIGTEPTTVSALRRMTDPPPLGGRIDDAESGLVLSGQLANPHPRGEIVHRDFRDGPFTIAGKTGNTLRVHRDVLVSHPAGSIVEKEGTEIKAVIRVLSPTRVEIDPLHFDHRFNTTGVEHVRVGRTAYYSLGVGRGRLDALEAVDAARSYSHDLRDLVIRNFMADDGVNNRAAQEVESPDLWVRNRSGDTAQTFPNYDNPGPHELPEITVDPAIHIGTGPNDLEVSGTCTSDPEVTFTIEIDHTGPDTFTFTRDNGAPTTGVAISGTAQALGDGVSIRFDPATNHTLGDRWIVRARRITGRFLHVRVRNRGTQPFFEISQFSPNQPPDPLAIAGARLLLCVTDGFPVCRFATVGSPFGTDDLQAVSAYTGSAPRALYTIEATTSNGDFRWYRDGTVRGTFTLSATTLDQPLDDGVRVRFGSHFGHFLGDRWNLYARSGAANDPFMNIDHYWELPLGAPAFDPASGRTGTAIMLNNNSISGLPAGGMDIFLSGWPEAMRLPTNNPNVPKPTLPRRLFLLGEVVPHDGALTGVTARTNNNLSFRELVFAKIRFTINNGADPLEAQLDVDHVGLQTTKELRVEVRCTAGTFATERVRLRFTARKGQGPEDVRTFRFSSGWGWEGGAPQWAVVDDPLEARRPDGSQPAAAGEQFDIQFDCTLTVDKTFSDVVIDAQIMSDFRELAVHTARHSIAIFAIAPLPNGTRAATALRQPKPSSFVFTDFDALTQNAQQAFGPVDGSPATRYRTTALFRSTADAPAFAPVPSFVALQRDPANNDTVNLILRPIDQPLAGFTPIKYFLFRGLRLADFLKGTTGPDAALIREPAGASPFITLVWTIFLAHNPGAIEMPSTLFGYDPAQPATDKLDEIFLRVGAPMQLPLAMRGLELGKFHNAGGNADFGFEIVIEEGDFRPDLEYARKASNVIDISGMPNGTPAEKFARRIKQEEILAYLDPAVFYGLHMHEGGKVDTPGDTHTGQGIYHFLVNRFFTRNRVYLDIRSENGSSLNFQQNYDTGSGNHLQLGIDDAPPAPRPYATHGWPIVILDTGTTDPTDPAELRFLEVELPRKDNEKPVLYVAHGELKSPATGGDFVRDAELHTGPGLFTKPVRIAFPTVGPPFPPSGVAWVVRLFYGRLANPSGTLPDTVLKTLKYTDNVFGPVDRTPTWAGTAAIKWITTQDNRYVDAQIPQGWRQMMQCGLAEQTAGTPRVLLYAIATARDTASADFAPVRGVSNGISSQPSFFRESGLFKVFDLEHDQIDDHGTAVRTLRLRQRPADGFPPTTALLLGLTKVEFDALAARGPNLSRDYLRTLLLDDKQSDVDPNQRPYDTFRVGIQGLQTAHGEYGSDFPADEIRVYTVDGQLFASKDFAAAEPLPTFYSRTFEEAMGARIWPQRERRIASVDVAAKSITIASFDWRSEVFPGGKLKIDKSAAHNGGYTVGTVTVTAAGDTVIVFSAGPALSTNTPLGSAFSPARPVEDMFIDRDQDGTVSGIAATRALVDGFVADVAAIPNDPSAKTAIETRINDVAPKLLNRARARAVANRARSEDHERTLYWARLRLLVAIKSHPFCLSSLSARNALITILETKSRGYDLNFSGAPAGAEKVLITGFDPFQLDLDIETSNPSAAIALALHGQIVNSFGRDAYIESAIFPVRYRDFDAGLVEALVNPRLDGPGQVSTIVTISQNGAEAFFDLERFAGRRRGGFPDNDRFTTGPQQIGGPANDAFYETTLPAIMIVGGAPFTSPPDDDQHLFFDQSFESENPPDRRAHPLFGGPNDNTPSFALSTITGQAVEGSGGDYLSNEIFYRVAHRRQKGFAAPSTTQTGHFHVPSPKNMTNKTILDVIAEVEELIRGTL